MNVAAFCLLTLTAIGAGPRGYVLEFSSQTCGPCQQMAPVVSKLEREGLPIRSVDVNDERALAEQYQVSSIPTFILVVDGLEVERLKSVQPEGRIRQMLAKIPGQNRGSSSDRLAVQLGDAAPLPRPVVTVPTEPRQSSHTDAGSAVAREGGRSLSWPFSKKNKPQDPPIIRGNSPGPMPGSDLVSTSAPTPMDASVRLRVLTGNKLVRGSGTIIESLAGRTTILTCSHISRNATDETKVEVDLFRAGQPVTYVGTIVASDPIADIGLISIRTDEVFPASPIAAVSTTPPAGEKVVSIGCGGGELPSREQLRVVEVNRYKGPDTLVCTGIPVQGRSGGGLFNESGTLVGVCFAADETGKSGVYCGLKPIHKLLTQHTLAHLLPASDSANESLVATEERSSTSDWPGDILRDEEALPGSPAISDIPKADTATLAQTPSAESISAGDAEVVVLIRSRAAGSAGDKVILIHKPSRKFLQFVEGEVSGDPVETAPLTSQKPTAPERQTARAVHAKPSTRALQPTGLETLRAPRPYVRSVR